MGDAIVTSDAGPLVFLVDAKNTLPPGRVVLDVAAKQFRSIVNRTVVNEDHFRDGQRLGEYTFDSIFQTLEAVIDWYNNGDRRVHWKSLAVCGMETGKSRFLV